MPEENEKLYAAFSRVGDGPSMHVTLQGQVFLASKPPLETMIAAMKVKHPHAQFFIEEVKSA